MARKINTRERKPYIIVFWEGESEEAYMKFMRNEFHEYLNLTVNPQKGVFEAAKKAFSTSGIYADDTALVDEIWFIFDTEPDLRNKWDEYYATICQLRKKCKRSNTRLLMTKGCIEYYFMLHYEQTAPHIISPADKERVLNELKKKYCTNYKKGDSASIYEIARNYPTAVKNGIWSLKRLEDEVEDILIKNDERDRKLFITGQTFSNVHEGIEYLIEQKIKAQGRSL